MLETAKASFAIVGANTAAPKYFWRGVHLAEVLGMVAHVEEDTQHIKLRVLNTTSFDSQYSEMTSSGIQIKKVSG